MPLINEETGIIHMFEVKTFEKTGQGHGGRLYRKAEVDTEAGSQKDGQEQWILREPYP